jgi:AcrR family transcriptional regulator
MTTTTHGTTTHGTARERLLAAATELFYAEGVHTVGIDRVIERAGVAKASLYNTFGSKDELVRAYLAGRQEARKARIERWQSKADSPREKILAVYDAMGEAQTESDFRGCAFANASAEAQPGSMVEVECDNSRAWLRSLFADLARQSGARDPDLLARQLVLLYDGATMSGRMDRDRTTAAAARAMAAGLVDAATAG